MSVAWVLLGIVCSVHAPHPCRTVTMAVYPRADWCESGRKAMLYYSQPGLIKVWCERRTDDDNEIRPKAAGSVRPGMHE
jgi:hypothetical protein